MESEEKPLSISSVSGQKLSLELFILRMISSSRRYQVSGKRLLKKYSSISSDLSISLDSLMEIKSIEKKRIQKKPRSSLRPSSRWGMIALESRWSSEKLTRLSRSQIRRERRYKHFHIYSNLCLILFIFDSSNIWVYERLQMLMRSISISGLRSISENSSGSHESRWSLS